ncbi:MAG: PAS domain-containing sensor histidine kinase [Chloroflexi bacterium]|nr:PAS domain-containing sensor histidine kinase [Chloroflexota bacterium]
MAALPRAGWSRLWAAWGRIHRWSQSACDLFYPYRPRIDDWRFWAIQGLVIVIATTHTTLEVFRSLGHTALVGSSPSVPFLSFVPVSLFIIPVVWAALGFGLPGALATAAWCTLLTVPNFVMHPGAERARELWQMGLVDLVAIFVGQRVDREFAARRRAQDVSDALRASEIRFRNLFESSPVSVLVVGADGAVLDANPAATTLFGVAASALKGRYVGDLVCGAWPMPGQNTGATKPRQITCTIRRADGTEVLVEPAFTRVASDGGPVVQVMLMDVTEERRRQVGLRAFAAAILKAQEEERKRMAQELHDETIQSLILLCRRLDTIEGNGQPLSPTTVEDLDQARGSAEHVVEELRAFARLLRPPTLDELGLTAAIRRLLADVEDRSRLAVKFQLIGTERRLPPDCELGIYRIIQEALRNVERHAGARSAAVTLLFDNAGIRAEVTDDGVGFATSEGTANLAEQGQLGILGMSERAELLGGQFAIESAPDRGTKVKVTVPVSGRLPSATEAPRIPPVAS